MAEGHNDDDDFYLDNRTVKNVVKQTELRNCIGKGGAMENHGC